MEIIHYIPPQWENLKSGLDVMFTRAGNIVVTLVPRTLPRAFQRDCEPRFATGMVEDIQDKPIVERAINDLVDGLLAQLLRDYPDGN